MSTLVGFANDAADAIIGFAEDPVQGMVDLGQAIVTNVINRIKGLVDIAFIAGEALGNLVTLDFDALSESAQKAGVAITQVTTGLNENQQNALAESIRETTEEIQKNIEESVKLENARRALNIQNQELSKSLETLRAREQELQLIADDTTKSFLEREQAAEQARSVSESAAQREIEIAQNNLSLINQEICLLYTSPSPRDATLSRMPSSA